MLFPPPARRGSVDRRRSTRVSSVFGSSIVAPAVVAVMAFVGAACGEIGEPDLGSPPSSSTTLLDETVSDVGDSAASQAAPASVESPPRPEGYVAELLITTEDGVLLGDPDDVEALGSPLDTVNPASVHDDFFGGLVVQTTERDVLWFPAEGGEGGVVNNPDEEGVRGNLLDVGFRDGTPEAILGGDGNRIDLVQLVTGERLPLLTMVDGTTLVDLSASGGLFGVILGDEECGALLFLNALGEEVDIAGPSSVDCPVPRRAAYGEIAIAPDADAYVYTEIAYRDDGAEASTDLVGWEISSGTQLFRIQIGEPGERISSLSFDGQRIIFLSSSLDAEEVDGLVVIDTSAPELAIPIVEVSALQVSFARLPVTVGLAVDQ